MAKDQSTADFLENLERQLQDFEESDRQTAAKYEHNAKELEDGLFRFSEDSPEYVRILQEIEERRAAARSFHESARVNASLVARARSAKNGIAGSEDCQDQDDLRQLWHALEAVDSNHRLLAERFEDQVPSLEGRLGGCDKDSSEYLVLQAEKRRLQADALFWREQVGSSILLTKLRATFGGSNQVRP